MKKILIASAALLATTTVASAQELNFSGLARFGIGYNDGRTGVDEETLIISRFRLNIDVSTETDGGVRLAARLRGEANENSDGTGGTFSFGAPRFQASAGGFRVRVGNISGVIDAASTVNTFGNDLGLEGTIGRIDSFGFPSPGFSSSGAGSSQGINIRYETGPFAAMASYTDENTSAGPETEVWEIGASYSFGDFNVGAAYGNTDGPLADEDFWLITFDGSFGDFGFSVNVGDNEVAADDVAYGIAVDYDISAATNIRFTWSDGGVADLPGNDASYGIGFIHQLGGDASLRGFVGETIAGDTAADLGVVFNF